MLFAPLWLLLVIPPLLAWYAQGRVRAVFNRYQRVPNSQRATGLDIARYLLDQAHLRDVRVVLVQGRFTDQYNPVTNTLGLSQTTASTPSVASLGVVAHEIGHATQDYQGYSLLRLRVGLARRLAPLILWSPFVLLWGILLGIPILLFIAALLLAVQVVFAVVTLPVERDASERAMAMLEQTGLVMPIEREGVRRVLSAATLTYLVALGQRLALFLFLVLLLLSLTAR